MASLFVFSKVFSPGHFLLPLMIFLDVLRGMIIAEPNSEKRGSDSGFFQMQDLSCRVHTAVHGNGFQYLSLSISKANLT